MIEKLKIDNSSCGNAILYYISISQTCLLLDIGIELIGKPTIIIFNEI